MLTLRLQRVGRKHDPSYRIVATNSRTGPKSNKHVELLGQYDAIRKTKNIDTDAVKRHIANGATVSDTLRNILIGEGIIDGKKVNALSKKSPIVDEEAIAAEKAKQQEAEEKAAADAKAAEEAESAEADAPADDSTDDSSDDTDDADTKEVAEETQEPEEETKEEEPVKEEKEEA